MFSAPGLQPATEDPMQLLAVSFIHVQDYLRTGSNRAAHRARLLLDHAIAGGDGRPQLAAAHSLLDQMLDNGRPRA